MDKVIECRIIIFPQAERARGLTTTTTTCALGQREPPVSTCTCQAEAYNGGSADGNDNPTLQTNKSSIQSAALNQHVLESQCNEPILLQRCQLLPRIQQCVTKAVAQIRILTVHVNRPLVHLCGFLPTLHVVQRVAKKSERARIVWRQFYYLLQTENTKSIA
jgi:hypothetical protein